MPFRRQPRGWARQAPLPIFRLLGFLEPRRLISIRQALLSSSDHHWRASCGRATMILERRSVPTVQCEWAKDSGPTGQSAPGDGPPASERLLEGGRGGGEEQGRTGWTQGLGLGEGVERGPQITVGSSLFEFRPALVCATRASGELTRTGKFVLIAYDKAQTSETANRRNGGARVGASFVTIDGLNVRRSQRLAPLSSRLTRSTSDEASRPWLVPRLADGQGSKLPCWAGDVAFFNPDRRWPMMGGRIRNRGRLNRGCDCRRALTNFIGEEVGVWSWKLLRCRPVREGLTRKLKYVM